MSNETLPEYFSSQEHLEEVMSRPDDATIQAMRDLSGDVMLLGVGGKIGPSLALMLKRATEQAGVNRRIIGVSRFSNLQEREKLESRGIETIAGDLLDTHFLHKLPQVRHIIFLAGMKFGSLDNPGRTWMMNAYLPGAVISHFKRSNIVAYSTGCVYPLVPVKSGGSRETDIPQPIGEYAQSCLGRERIFQYASQNHKTPVILIRLNYAVEPRYGVLTDIACKVKEGKPIDLTMGYFNVIWQGDANRFVIKTLHYTSSPANYINISGPEVISVKEIATWFERYFGKTAILQGEEAPTALLTNSQKAFDQMGLPSVKLEQLLHWIGHWVEHERNFLGKPTHYEVRDGKY